MRRRPAPAQPKPAQPPPQWLRPLAVALCVLALTAWFASAVANPDTWWHLETGRYIVQTHHLPSPDPFAFTTAAAKPAYAGEETVRQFNLTHEWLGQAIFYLAWAVGGAPLLILLRAAMLTAFCVLAGHIVFRRTGGLYRAIGAALVAAAIAGNFAADRPFLFTYLLLAIVICLLETHATGWKVWLLPPLFLFWANCHGGYFLGWVALGAYVLESLIRPGDRLARRRLLAVSAASLLISGVNPNGFRALSVTLAYRSSTLQSSLWEWQHPQLWPPDLFVGVLFLAAVVLLWRRERVRPADWVLFIAFAAASMVAIRNTILIGWLGPVLIASYVPWSRAIPRWSEFAAAALLLVACVAEAATGSSFQLRAEEWLYPKGAADFVLSHHLPGPIFNTYEHGGYLMWRLWPRQKVFIDGRALSDTLFHDYQRILYAMPADKEPGGLALLDSYGIQTIIVNGFEYGSGAIYRLPVNLALSGQTEWELVYRDAQAMVFVRHLPSGVAALPLSQALDSMEAQCSTHMERLPGEPLCANYLAVMFSREGQPDRARRWMQIFRQAAGAGQ